MMNIDESFNDEATAETLVEEEKEKPKEKTVSAKLMLTEEQKGLATDYLINVSNNAKPSRLVSFKMDERTLSGTAEFSEDENEVLLPPSVKEAEAKFAFTPRQQRDLLEAFNLLDYTGEGKIKAEDFRVAIKALGYEPTKEELQKMVNGVDKGNTGRLSFENFQTAIMRKIMSLDNDGDIMKSFRLYDMDDTGLISFNNLKKVTRILEIPQTDEEIEEMIDDADTDMNGFVSVEEFMKIIKNCVHIVTP